MITSSMMYKVTGEKFSLHVVHGSYDLLLLNLSNFSFDRPVFILLPCFTVAYEKMIFIGFIYCCFVICLCVDVKLEKNILTQQ